MQGALILSSVPLSTLSTTGNDLWAQIKENSPLPGVTQKHSPPHKANQSKFLSCDNNLKILNQYLRALGMNYLLV